jgi:RNA polymerase sigma-70 factor (ECF subfamily)
MLQTALIMKTNHPAAGTIPAEPKKKQNPDEWVDQYGDYLYRYALMRLKDPTAAKDVIQETYIAGFKGLDRFDGRVDVKYWLRGILRNKIVDHIRKAVRERPCEDPLEFQDDDGISRNKMKYFGIPSSDPMPWEFEPHHAYEESEFWTIFRQCVDQLKDNHRQAYVLKEIEGMSTDEVCEIMDISPNNLWVVIHRARAQLKTLLEKNWNN